MDPSAKPRLSPDQDEIIAAVQAGNFDRVASLLTVHAELANTRDLEGHSLFQIAASLVAWFRPNHARIAQYLADHGADCDIYAAARAGLLDHVRRLLDADPRLLNAPDSLGHTALQHAALAAGGGAETDAVADFLLQRGANVDVFTACALGLLDAVKQCIEADRRSIHARYEGATPLHWAVRPRRNADAALAVCTLLVDARADLNAEDAGAHGMTALHHAAAWSDSTAIAELLVNRGAELNIRDDDGWTALDRANDGKHRRMAAFLRSRGAQEANVAAAHKFGAQAREMIGAVKKGDIDAVAALLDDNPGLVAVRGDWGETPLHWAAFHGYATIAELLIRRGADVHTEAAAKHGGTPLAWAAEQHLDLVELLYSHSAAVNAVNSLTGGTPLHACAANGDCPEIAEFLLAHGAAINARDAKDRTPISYAYEFGHNEVAAVLRRHKAKEF
jgi:ankyrin repeat protein